MKSKEVQILCFGRKTGFAMAVVDYCMTARPAFVYGYFDGMFIYPHFVVLRTFTT